MKKYIGLCLLAFALLLISACQPQSEHTAEMRGMWVATTQNLDFPSKPGLSAKELRDEADALLDEASAMGINAIFLQVRPSADSLYPSHLFPWSSVLSGVQGVTPDENVDILEYWVSGAHARGMQLHAWINPFRVTASKNDVLSQNHPAIIHPEWTILHHDGRMYWNPGLQEVRQYIIDGVMEIVSRYEVDGVHFDDYFYPDETFPDSATFAASGQNDLLAWRRENINALIRETNKTIDAYDSSVVFGVSPFGIWQNNTSSLSGSHTRGLESFAAHAADSRRWVKEGWVDYLAPQIYWQIGHELADYQTLVDWWVKQVNGTGVKLYIGLAGYRAVEAEPGTVWYAGEELARQLEMNRNNPGVSGSIHFRIGSYLKTPELVSVLKKQYIEYQGKEEEQS